MLRGESRQQYVIVDARWQHFSLFLAIGQVDEVLHADKAGPAVFLGDAEGAGKLPSVHRGGADIARFAGLNDIVQRFEHLLDRRVMVETMDLIEVDIIHTEPMQAVVDFREDRFA